MELLDWDYFVKISSRKKIMRLLYGRNEAKPSKSPAVKNHVMMILVVKNFMLNRAVMLAVKDHAIRTRSMERKKQTENHLDSLKDLS